MSTTVKSACSVFGSISVHHRLRGIDAIWRGPAYPVGRRRRSEQHSRAAQNIAKLQFRQQATDRAGVPIMFIAEQFEQPLRRGPFAIVDDLHSIQAADPRIRGQAQRAGG